VFTILVLELLEVVFFVVGSRLEVLCARTLGCFVGGHDVISV